MTRKDPLDIGPAPQAPSPPGWPPAEGTYPPVDGSEYLGTGWQYTPPYQEPPRPIKRVGRITVAVSLILFGIMMLLRLFMANLDFMFIAKLTPLLLVLLGAEILYMNIRYRDDFRLRYDILSVIVSVFLIGGCLLVAVVPEYIAEQERRGSAQQRLATELKDISYDVLTAQGLHVDSIEWYVSLYDTSVPQDMQVSDIKSEHYVQFRVYMSRTYDDALAFAEDAHAILEALSDLVPGIDYASLYSFRYDDTVAEQRFALWLDSRFQFALPANELAERVDVEYLTDGWYMTADRLVEWQEDQAREAFYEELYSKYDLGFAIESDGYYFFPDGTVIPAQYDLPPYTGEWIDFWGEGFDPEEAGYTGPLFDPEQAQATEDETAVEAVTSEPERVDEPSDVLADTGEATTEGE